MSFLRQLGRPGQFLTICGYNKPMTMTTFKTNPDQTSLSDQTTLKPAVQSNPSQFETIHPADEFPSQSGTLLEGSQETEAKDIQSPGQSADAGRALILGGGGSRGSYTIGALYTLIEQKHQYDYVSGISIGALVGAAYATGQPVDFSAIINGFSNESVATGLFQFPKRNDALKASPGNFDEFVYLFQQDGPSVLPLRTNFGNLFDFEAFKNSPIDYACLAADLSANQAVRFTKADMIDKEDAINKILASAAYFPAFEYVNINGSYYADGGYLNSTLGQDAVEMGMNHLDIIALTDPNAPVNYCQKQTDVLVRPILKLTYFLDFDKPTMLRQIEQGRLEALKYMGLTPGYIYTFYPEDAFLFKTLSKTAVAILNKNHISLNNEMLIGGISELLGYRPGALDNKYMKDYQMGLLLECLGLITGISPYQRYHVLPFVKEIINHLENYKVVIHPGETGNGLKMDRFGAEDLMAFFHHALTVNDGSLPDQYDLIKKKFRSLYYLALAWYILDKFSLIINLF